METLLNLGASVIFKAMILPECNNAIDNAVVLRTSPYFASCKAYLWQSIWTFMIRDAFVIECKQKCICIAQFNVVLLNKAKITIILNKLNGPGHDNKNHVDEIQTSGVKINQLNWIFSTYGGKIHSI